MEEHIQSTCTYRAHTLAHTPVWYSVCALWSTYRQEHIQSTYMEEHNVLVIMVAKGEAPGRQGVNVRRVHLHAAAYADVVRTYRGGWD